jgi:hypothetical protein
MNNEHVISNHLLAEVDQQLQQGNHWIVYNTQAYYLDKGDLWCFNDREEAYQFAADNVSDHDDYNVIHVSSLIDLFKQLPYASDLHFPQYRDELEKQFQQFDWNHAQYDPLHDTIEATSDAEKEELREMETLLDEWETYYKRDPVEAIALTNKYWEARPMERYKNNFITKKQNTMNETNLEALKKNLKYLGFGEGLNEQLQKNIEEQKENFTLQHQATFNNKPMDATLHFKAGGQNEMYFFNRYEAKLEDKQQTFYIDRGNGVTMKEAFNLLEGRAVNKDLVNKEGEKYNAWVQLNFEEKDNNDNFKLQRYHENFGYDLDKVVQQYPIKELKEEKTKDDLYQSLEKGNTQAVRFEINGKEELHYIQADPRRRDVIVHDKEGNRLSYKQADALKLPSAQANGKEHMQEQAAKVKQEPSGGGDEDGPELKKKRNRSQSKGMAL